MANKNPERVRFGHVSLPFHQHKKGWRWAWRDPAAGKWRYGTRKDRKEALAAAHRQAVALANTTTTLHSALSDPSIESVIKRAVQLGITHADLDRIADFKIAEIHPFGQVADQFYAAKESARGKSRRNIRVLRSHIDAMKERFGNETSIADITISDLEAYINHGTTSARTRKNRRGTAVTLWRWARSRRLLPDETTTAERTEKPLVTRGVPSTWTPEQLAKMWTACPESHRPWLALSAWAGVRAEECYQEDPLSDKDVIRWRDIARGHLEIRPEVAKTGVRRIIPLCTTLSAFLSEERMRRHGEPDGSPVCPGRPPSRDLPIINRAVTTILGEAVGCRWKPNALRHSRISYRSAQVGISRAALEAGNSESEAKRSYHDAMTEADATAWFNPFGTPSEPALVEETNKVTPIR